MKSLFRLSLLGLLVTMTAGARAADLVELYQQARAQDPVFQAATQAREAGQEARAQGRALLRPAVSFQGDLAYNWSKSDEVSLFSSGDAKKYASGRLALQASQPLWNRDYSLQARQGNVTASLADIQLEIEKQNLALRVAQAYFDVLDASDAQELVVAQKAATGQQLAQARKAFEVGTATITDTHEAQARADLIAAQEIAAQNNLAVARNALRQLTGQEVAVLPSLRADVNLSAVAPGELQLWLDRAAGHNWALRAGLLNEEFAQLNLKRADAAHWPTLDAVAAWAENRDPEAAQGGDSRGGSVGLQLKVPLYAGGALSSRSRQNLSLLKQARFQTEGARRSAEQQVREAYLNTTSGLASIKALEQALTSTRSTLDSTTLGRQVGVRTNLDVLNAQQQFYAARRDLAQAKYRYLLYRLQLESAAGELDLADLQAINGLLVH